MKIIETVRIGKPARSMEVDERWLVAKTGSLAFMQRGAILHLSPVMFDALKVEIEKAGPDAAAH